MGAFISPWAGTLVNHQFAKGLLFWLPATVLAAGAAFARSEIDGWAGFLAVWLAGIVDVTLIANKLEKGEPVGKWRFF